MPPKKDDKTILDLLYRYSHCGSAAPSKEKNDLGRELTTALGVGEHRIGGRLIIVKTPVAKEGWIEYDIIERGMGA